MGQRSNYTCAAMKEDAQIKYKKEECASSMGQHGKRNDAALKDAQINSNEEEYARDMVHTAITMMNLQLSQRVLDQNSIRLH